jgi:hypothetical protein
VLQTLADEHPNDVDILIATAREAVVAGIVSATVERQNEWFEVGEGYANRALELEPGRFDAEYWLVVAQGKRATHSSPLTAARLGISVYEHTHRLLARDSLHAGANHALGVLNFEVMKLSAPMRFIARTLAPHGYLRDTSWENAEFYIGRAVDLEPEFLLYRLDLGKTFYFQGRYEPARRWFQSVLECPPLDVPTDPVFRAEAQRYLGLIDDELQPGAGG